MTEEGADVVRGQQLAVLGVVNLTHRGAVSADAASGDGAGVTIQIPHELLPEEARRLGITVEPPEHLPVAMTFLPPDDADRPAARAPRLDPGWPGWPP